MKSESQTILVVDDNPVNLSILSDFLSRSGYTLFLKKDGEKALALIDRKKPDIILLDILMPVLDGYETCRRLKEREDTKDIPVIFMTALSEMENKIKGFELGAVDYITKPFQQEEVLARVKAHLTIQSLKKDLQVQNRQLQESLEREKKVVEDLRLNLSLSLPHELRTPLNSILGFSEILKDITKPTDLGKISTYGAAIYESGRHLHRLIENALLYANLRLLKFTSDNSKKWQRDCSTKTKDSIISIAKKCAADAERLKDLVLDLTDADIKVSLKNFDKILTEITSNAFKFSQPDTPVTIKSATNGNLYLLSISDKGRGMTRQQKDQIGAFMQFDRRIYEQQGSGLGLIIACLLVQLEGGIISIESQENQGTTISMIFHRNTQTPDSPTSEPACWFHPDEVDELNSKAESLDSSKSSWKTKFKVLVISDNITNRIVISNLMAEIGCEVIESPDMSLGLHKVIQHKPHLIFLNMDSLDEDDFDDIEKLRKSPSIGALKIIALTEKKADAVNKIDFFQWVDDILFIPVSKKDILACLEMNIKQLGAAL